MSSVSWLLSWPLVDGHDNCSQKLGEWLQFKLCNTVKDVVMAKHRRATSSTYRPVAIPSMMRTCTHPGQVWLLVWAGSKGGHLNVEREQPSLKRGGGNLLTIMNLSWRNHLDERWNCILHLLLHTYSQTASAAHTKTYGEFFLKDKHSIFPPVTCSFSTIVRLSMCSCTCVCILSLLYSPV